MLSMWDYNKGIKLRRYITTGSWNKTGLSEWQQKRPPSQARNYRFWGRLNRERIDRISY